MTFIGSKRNPKGNGESRQCDRNNLFKNSFENFHLIFEDLTTFYNPTASDTLPRNGN